jgi:hypothetical protein
VTIAGKVTLTFTFCMAVSALAKADTLSCSGPKVTVEGISQVSPDKYGDTMNVQIGVLGEPLRYEHIHPLMMKDEYIYISALNYDGFVDRVRIDLGPRSGLGQYKNAKLRLHYNGYEYKESYPGYNDYVPIEIKQDFELTCSVSDVPVLENPCSGKTSEQIDQALVNAAGEKSVDQVLQTLSCGANPNAVTIAGCTPLMLSAETSSFDCGIRPRPLDNLNFARSRAIFMTLLNSGAFSVQADGMGRTVLHKLVKNSELDLLKELIDLAEDLDVQDNDGVTPLMLAASLSSANAVKLLVAGGASLELKNSKGETAYDLGIRLDSKTRSMLLQPAVTIEISGQNDGSCSPLNLEVPAATAVKLKLNSSKSKMFMFTMSSANISLMADAGKTVEKTFILSKPGAYPFKCGVMGGSQFNGTIVAK